MNKEKKSPPIAIVTAKSQKTSTSPDAKYNSIYSSIYSHQITFYDDRIESQSFDAFYISAFDLFSFEKRSEIINPFLRYINKTAIWKDNVSDDVILGWKRKFNSTAKPRIYTEDEKRVCITLHNSDLIRRELASNLDVNIQFFQVVCTALATLDLKKDKITNENFPLYTQPLFAKDAQKIVSSLVAFCAASQRIISPEKLFFIIQPSLLRIEKLELEKAFLEERAKYKKDKSTTRFPWGSPFEIWDKNTPENKISEYALNLEGRYSLPNRQGTTLNEDDKEILVRIHNNRTFHHHLRILRGMGTIIPPESLALGINILLDLVSAIIARLPSVPLGKDGVTEHNLPEQLSDKSRSKLSEVELKEAIKRFTTPGPKRELNVKAIRESIGLSQSQFAAEFCIPAGSVRNWEQGISKPREASQLALAMIALEPEVARRVVPFLKALM